MQASKTSKKILMCFSIGKQSQPKFKIIPNKILFSYSAYKQSKPKKKSASSIQSNLNVLWCSQAK